MSLLEIDMTIERSRFGDWAAKMVKLGGRLAWVDVDWFYGERTNTWMRVAFPFFTHPDMGSIAVETKRGGPYTVVAFGRKNTDLGFLEVLDQRKMLKSEDVMPAILDIVERFRDEERGKRDDPCRDDSMAMADMWPDWDARAQTPDWARAYVGNRIHPGGDRFAA